MLVLLRIDCEVNQLNQPHTSTQSTPTRYLVHTALFAQRFAPWFIKCSSLKSILFAVRECSERQKISTLMKNQGKLRGYFASIFQYTVQCVLYKQYPKSTSVSQNTHCIRRTLDKRHPELKSTALFKQTHRKLASTPTQIAEPSSQPEKKGRTKKSPHDQRQAASSKRQARKR